MHMRNPRDRVLAALLIGALAGVFFSAGSAGAAQRKVLIENFTSNG